MGFISPISRERWDWRESDTVSEVPYINRQDKSGNFFMGAGENS
jgi:hypothetical protein